MMNERILRDLERLQEIETKMGGLTFPPFIDSSMRAPLAECGQKFNFSSIQKLRPREESVHLVFGGAFAAGLAETRTAFWRDGVSSSQARLRGFEALLGAWGNYEPRWSEPGQPAKTLDTCVGALDFYFDQFPMEQDYSKPLMYNGTPAVEFSFAIPIPEVRHPETGDPILYVGRFDMLAEMRGMPWVQDEKSASQLGKYWQRKWELRSQFTGYCFAARHYDYPVQGAIIRGVAIYKTKFEKAEAIVYREQWKIDRWYHQLVRDLNRAIESWKTGVWDYNLDDACSAFGGCPFLELCNKSNPEAWIDGYYVRHNWNPMEKD
jgi:hypothetical protein